MQRRRLTLSILVLIASLTVVACTSTPTPTTVPAATATPSAKDFEDFDPSHFSQPNPVTNLWMPLTPGMRFVYEGTTVEDDGSTVPHRVEIHVTDLTKVIAGVRSAVTWDLDFSNNQLVEAELAFFAQDDGGTIWRMGEYPEEYVDGEVVASPAWIHGLQDAHAGIMMLANPQTGTPSYSEGWAPRVGWTDRGQVDQTGQKTCVPVTCYENVLIIAETSQAEVGAFQLKHYAPGLGNIKADWRGADATQEVLELTLVEQLSPAALAEVRAQALELEKSAYARSLDVYVYTSPLEYPVGTPLLDITPLAAVTPQAPTGAAALEVVVYASDLPASALFELEMADDPASPGGKFITLPNNGDELDPPPENDPHATFTIQVQKDVAYRCWVHMKVGEPQGRSQANVLWVQFTGALDESGQEMFKPGTDSYFTAEGPARAGWTWVECDRADSEAEPVVYFAADGEVTVQIQAGMEGVGFDQLILSAERFLNAPPTDAIVEK